MLRQHHHRARKDRDAALEVDRAAAVDVAVLDQAGKRIDRPFVALDPDRVRVRGEEDRLLAAVAMQPREQVRLPRLWRRHDFDLEPERL